MPTGYSRSPKLLKGALVEFSERFLGPIPNIIVFQYNPESLTRTLSPWTPATSQGGKGGGTAAGQCVSQPGEVTPPVMAQPHDPPETFTLPLELDATDALEEPEKHPVAVISGLTDVDAITLSIGRLFAEARIDADTAWRVIFVASLSNLLFKAGIVAAMGGKQLRRRALPVLAGLTAIGFTGTLLWP